MCVVKLQLVSCFQERSADKELSDSKRRKESPDSKDVDIKVH